jgi:hypothetical protein
MEKKFGRDRGRNVGDRIRLVGGEGGDAGRCRLVTSDVLASGGSLNARELKGMRVNEEGGQGEE